MPPTSRISAAAVASILAGSAASHRDANNGVAPARTFNMLPLASMNTRRKAMNDNFPAQHLQLHQGQSQYRHIPMPPEFRKNHAIHDNLVGERGIKKISYYVSPSFPLHTTSTPEELASKADDNKGKEIIVADLEFGNSVNGHRGIVHGGISSLIFDDVFGFAYFIACGGLMRFTANLNVNYRSPLPQNTKAVIRVKLVEIERRKVKMEGQLTSIDGKTVYAEATALYIIARGFTKLKSPVFQKMIESKN